MKIIPAFLVMTFLFACNSEEKKAAAENIVAEPGALTTIQWLDTARSIGKITEGEKVEITYRFVNSGDKPLVIQSIGVSCGCTVAEKPGELFAPGKGGVIKAVFDSKGRLGSNHKTVTVYANTEQPMHPLTFDVEVVPAK
ncbi:MAG TPA: DUF1573 domain-containing protein [Chitinophagaceae bacterium]|nr:DUF1573 domain-containing protein [Chitinophagaceae bacterium]